MTQLAAKRMANYWNTRIELFGGKAFTPFTATDIRSKDGKELSLGFLRLIPDTDGTGRVNIFVDPSLLEGEYDEKAMTRVCWGMCTVTLPYLVPFVRSQLRQ